MFSNHMCFARFIIIFEVFPKSDKSFHIESLWTDHELFEFEKLDEFIRLGSIRDHEKWNIMDTSKDS